MQCQKKVKYFLNFIIQGFSLLSNFQGGNISKHSESVDKRFEAAQNMDLQQTYPNIDKDRNIGKLKQITKNKSTEFYFLQMDRRMLMYLEVNPREAAP